MVLIVRIVLVVLIILIVTVARIRVTLVMRWLCNIILII